MSGAFPCLWHLGPGLQPPRGTQGGVHRAKPRGSSPPVSLRRRNRRRGGAGWLTLLLVWSSLWLADERPVAADVFTVRLENGETVKLVARHAGTGQGACALEFSDGQLHLLPVESILTREPQPDPPAIAHEELLRRLLEEFGEHRTLAEIEKPFVIILVRAGTQASESMADKRLQAVLTKAGKFFRGMQNSFLEFVKQAHVETTPVKYPLPVIIFEHDQQFNAYAVASSQGQGLSAANTAAFYDLLSNRLVLRLSECTTFDTPLHEAVHQQAYNRGILQRLAPIPFWFNEGLATGFEGDGERIRSGPRAISDRYGQLALRARVVSWRELVTNDRVFQGDVLAGEAYGQAWGLHWLLVTKYRTEYNKLVRHFAAKKPLEIDRPDQRLAEFEQLVGKPIEALQREFLAELPRAMARRKN